MRNTFLAAGAALTLLTTSVFAQETTVTGTLGGAAIGAVVAGPAGALIGAGIGGAAGAASEPRYVYSDGIITTRSVALPPDKVRYVTLEDRYYLPTYKGKRNLKYAVIDDAGPTDKVIIVDPNEHYKIVQVVE